MLYDIENGIRQGDKDALSFNYDARPLVAGEAGAGTLTGDEFPCVCPDDLVDYCLTNAPCVSL